MSDSRALIRQSDVRWVRQEHAEGCGIATIAMLLGISYAEALALAVESPQEGDSDWDRTGCTHWLIDWVLAKAGAFIQRRYVAWGWPMEPFAPLHYASVTQPSGRTHFVVMLADGGVLDPLREGVHELSDWPGWNQITGVVRP